MKVTLKRLLTALLLLSIVWFVPQKALAKDPVQFPGATSVVIDDLEFRRVSKQIRSYQSKIPL